MESDSRPVDARRALHTVAAAQDAMGDRLEAPRWAGLALDVSTGVIVAAAGLPPERQSLLLPGVIAVRAALAVVHLRHRERTGRPRRGPRGRDPVLGWTLPGIAAALALCALSWLAARRGWTLAPPALGVLTVAVLTVIRRRGVEARRARLRRP
jgi:hypothetical protein